MTTIERNKIHLDYQVSGTGTPVIFISGISLDKNVWGGVQPAFGDYQAITFDNRDVGLSTMVDRPYTPRDMARDTHDLLREVTREPAHVVGHSLGGVVAQELALMAPDRVRSLVLVNTIAANDHYTTGVLGLWKTFADRMATPEEFSRGLLFFGVGRTLINALGVEALVQAFASPNPQPPDAFKRQVDACLAADTTERIARVRTPALVVWGEEDQLVPVAHSRQLLELIPNATGATIPAAGHSPLVENPQAFAAKVLEFIGRQ